MIPRMHDPLDPYHPANLMPHLFGRVEDEGPAVSDGSPPGLPPDAPSDVRPDAPLSGRSPGRSGAGQRLALLLRNRRGALLGFALVSAAAAVIRVMGWIA